MALHEGQPSVTATGAVDLWHRGCWANREVPIEVVVAAPVVAPVARPRSRRPHWIAAAVVSSALIGVGFAHRTFEEASGAASASTELANVELGEGAAIPEHTEVAVNEIAPPRQVRVETSLEARYPMPTFEGEDLDSVYPSLRGWTHPVTASAELMPELRSRHFGSERIGIERPECGAGHCGVDLDGPRGRPLVAVADGVIVRVERSELGADGKSGRYVRIQHDDGTLTAYMHMDDVAEELQVGDHVVAGQYVGTLGATAVYAAPPHLHFSIEVPNHPDDPAARGDTRDTHYIDPAPFLVRSTIVRTPIRRHVVKPAS